MPWGIPGVFALLFWLNTSLRSDSPLPISSMGSRVMTTSVCAMKQPEISPG